MNEPIGRSSVLIGYHACCKKIKHIWYKYVYVTAKCLKRYCLTHYDIWIVWLFLLVMYIYGNLQWKVFIPISSTPTLRCNGHVVTTPASKKLNRYDINTSMLRQRLWIRYCLIQYNIWIVWLLLLVMYFYGSLRWKYLLILAPISEPTIGVRAGSWRPRTAAKKLNRYDINTSMLRQRLWLRYCLTHYDIWIVWLLLLVMYIYGSLRWKDLTPISTSQPCVIGHWLDETHTWPCENHVRTFLVMSRSLG